MIFTFGLHQREFCGISRDMNEQIKFLANVIDGAKRGRQPSVEILRTICRKAADAAPADDLIRIAQFLHDLRMDAARAQKEKGEP